MQQLEIKSKEKRTLSAYEAGYQLSRHCRNKYFTVHKTTSSIAIVVIADERVVGVPPKDAVGQVTASRQSRPGGCKYQS